MTSQNWCTPRTLSQGQSLPDADVLMNIKMTPLNMKMSNKMSNRKGSGPGIPDYSRRYL